MKERPILFSSPMIRALLDGSKTQTRRIVKDQPFQREVDGLWLKRIGRNKWTSPERWEKVTKNRKLIFQRSCKLEFNEWLMGFCPYAVGDRLWVRETFCHQSEDGYVSTDKFWYAATDLNKDGTERSAWCPSVHMPREASRITLEITGVRVERVQGISEKDAKAEASPLTEMVRGTKVWNSSYRAGFRSLWSSVNGEESFEANPYVWVAKFKRVRP